MSDEKKDSNTKDFSLGTIAKTTFVKQLQVYAYMAVATILAAVAFFVLREPSLRPLAVNLDQQGLTQVVQILEKENYNDFTADTKRGAILVLGEDIERLRLVLAQNEFQNGDSKGWELFNTDRALGTTKFRESVKYTRAKEGEIEHSIETIHAVIQANVNLSIQEKSSFLTESEGSSASVTLQIKEGYRLSKKQLRAIRNLVASAVENLSPDSVTIVDQNLDYLTDEADPKYDDEQLTFKSSIEKRFTKKIVNMLAPLVGGETRIRANVTADIDFNTLEQTSERYLPEDSAIRSEHILKVEDHNVVNGGVPGSLTDTPPAAVTATEFNIQQQEVSSVPKHKKDEELNNYEVGRVYEHKKRASGLVERLSAAILIDNVITVDEEGNEIKVPFDEELVAKIEELAKSAIGFTSERGDVLTVLNAPFAERKQHKKEDIPFWQDETFVEYAVKLLLGTIIVIVLLIVRSIAVSRINQISEDSEEALQERIKELIPEEEPEEKDERPEEIQFTEELENVIDTVATDPDVTAQVFKNWIKSDVAAESQEQTNVQSNG